jgi:peptidoglycan/LPS O-acetylase OafA/YrhL
MPPAQTSPAGSNPDDKLIGIELLRFASAVAVLVFHYQHFAFVGGQQVNFVETAQPFYSPLKLFYQYGYYGVQVFWCISGFIFFWKYGRAIPTGKPSGYKFFVLRFSRLYPLHFATLLCIAVLQPLYFARHGAYFIYQYNDLYHFALQIFMASNWGFQVGDSFNGPIWSISIEVLAYFVFYLGLRHVSGSVALLVVMAVASTVIQFFKIATHPIFNCLMFFYLGCLTAVLYARVKDDARSRAFATVTALLLIAAICGLQLLIAVRSIYFLLVFSPALVMLCVMHIPATRFTSAVLVPAGNVTYSSYLLHVPIQLALVSLAAAAGLSIPIYSVPFFLTFIGGTLLLSFYCYKHFELPAQSYLRRRLQSRPAATLAAAPAMKE